MNCHLIKTTQGFAPARVKFAATAKQGRSLATAVPAMLGSAPLPRPRKFLTLATPPSAGAKGCERDSHPENN
jgi:hypothetical protein